MPRKAARGQPRMPPPADEFARCAPVLCRTYPQRWVRLAAKTRPLVDWDDRAVSRFSSPVNPFKVLYLADQKATAFWEVFGALVEDMSVDSRVLYESKQVAPRHFVNFDVVPGLRLIDFTEESTLHEVRANAGTFLAPYKYCQAWAAALMRHPLNLHGFLYQSCRRGSTAKCLALFSRPTLVEAESHVNAAPDVSHAALVDDPDFLRVLIDHDIDLR